MRTVTIQIGNSDDKLPQLDWCSFVGDIDSTIEDYAAARHFFGAPPNYEPWQNACWVIVCDESRIPNLKEAIERVREGYKQDSVAWTEGETVFI